MKQFLEDVRSVVSELAGGQAETTLTLAATACTPTAAVHSIDSQAGPPTDNLANLITTNTPDGRLVLIAGPMRPMWSLSKRRRRARGRSCWPTAPTWR